MFLIYCQAICKEWASSKFEFVMHAHFIICFSETLLTGSNEGRKFKEFIYPRIRKILWLIFRHVPDRALIIKKQLYSPLQKRIDLDNLSTYAQQI